MIAPVGSKGLFRVALVITCAAVTITAWWSIFSLFMLYDDEGYVLHSLNEFARMGGLYDDVYSQYGPVYYLLAGGAARLLGFEWTHDLGRLVTVLAYLLTAASAGLLTAQLSRSSWAGLLAFAATSAHLGQMAHEPMHPGNLLSPLLGFGTLISARFILQNRSRAFLVSVALLGTSCALIKINVGLFVILAGVIWWSLTASRESDSVTWVQRLTWLLLLIFPAVLMHRHLGVAWGFTYAAIATLGIASVASFIQPLKEEISLPWENLWLAVAAAMALAGLVAVGTVISGTSWWGLWQGIIAGPLNHSDIYDFPPNWRTGTLILTIASVVAAKSLHWRVQLAGTSAGTLVRCAASVQLVLILAFVVWSFFLPSKTVAGTMTVLVGSLGWLLIRDNHKEPDQAYRARVWVALTLVWQFLHGYPVAGTQLTWGTFLWIPLLITAASQSGRVLLAARENSPGLKKLIHSAYALVLVLVLAFPLRTAGFYYRNASPLGLSGAQLLRIPPGVGSAIRINAANAALNADLLYSLPGSFSYNLWTELPTPTAANVTHWVTLLSASQQAEIVDKMAATDRTAWVVQPDLADDWLEFPVHPSRPLLAYLRNHYARVTRVDGVELWLPQGRPHVVINFAQFFRSRALPADDSSGPPLIELNLALAGGTKIERIEVHTFHGDQVHYQLDHNWNGLNTTAAIRPLPTPDFAILSDEFYEANWPIDSPGLFTLRLRPEGPLPESPIKFWWLRFYDTSNNEVAEARFDVQPIE